MARFQEPLDGPADTHYEEEKPTGLLTRFVPARLRHTAFFKILLRLTRVLQFLSAVISLGIFSQRLYKVYRLVNSIKTRRGVNKSFGAVEGILAAAVLYTLIATVMTLIKKSANAGTKRWLRWLWVLFDLAFVGAFIAVSVLTRPNGGAAGPKHCYTNRNANNAANIAQGETANTQDDTCDLPWGTFILAIVSTLLHAITAAFHEIKDHHRKSKATKAEKKAAEEQYARDNVADERV